MAFNNMDSDSWKALFDLCLEQVDRDVVDFIVQEVEEEYENRDYADIPDLNEPYDDGHDCNSTETPMNGDHSSNSNDSIETSGGSSVLPQVVVSEESSGFGLPQDNLPVSVESSENDTLRFETLDIDQKQKDSSNSNSQKLGGVGEEAEDINQERLENNGDDGSQDYLYESHEEKQKYWLNIYQQLEGACMEIEDIIQQLEIIRETSLMDMDIELLKEEILDPAHQRRENLSKLVQDIEKEVALEDRKNRRKADSYLQELEESITEESDEENEHVTDEMYYSCDSHPWDTMSDISDYGSCSVDRIWDRLLAKSPDFCVDNRVPSEKSTMESDGNEASETQYSVPPNSPEEIKHGDEMNSAWRSNPIIISSSSSDSDADINPSMESDMEDIHLTDDEFEQTWEFINPSQVHSVPSQQSIKEKFLSYFGKRKIVAAEDQSV